MSKTLEYIRERMGKIPHGKQRILAIDTGLSVRTVNEIKTGKRKSPGIHTLEKILNWLDNNDIH